jgi:hypothetical protein
MYSIIIVVRTSNPTKLSLCDGPNGLGPSRLDLVSPRSWSLLVTRRFKRNTMIRQLNVLLFSGQYSVGYDYWTSHKSGYLYRKFLRETSCPSVVQMCSFAGSRDNAVATMNGYGLDGRGVGVWFPVEVRFFFPHRPDQFWGPYSLLSKGYRELFPRR